MSTLTVYPTVDGWATNGEASSTLTWAQLIAAAGTSNGGTDADVACIIFRGPLCPTTWRDIRRGRFTFDTSALTSGATISAATYTIEVTGVAGDISTGTDINIYGATPANETAMSNSDLNNVGSTPFSTAWQPTVAQHTYTFNSDGLAAISKTGYTHLSERNANFDVANVAPTDGGTNNFVNQYMSEQTGTSSDPVLVITYSNSTDWTQACGSTVTLSGAIQNSLTRGLCYLRALLGLG